MGRGGEGWEKKVYDKRHIMAEVENTLDCAWNGFIIICEVSWICELPVWDWLQIRLRRAENKERKVRTIMKKDRLHS